MASAESIRKNALFCDDMHFIDERPVTLKSFDATVYEGKVRARVSVCIRFSDTVSISYILSYSSIRFALRRNDRAAQQQQKGNI